MITWSTNDLPFTGLDSLTHTRSHTLAVSGLQWRLVREPAQPYLYDYHHHYLLLPAGLCQSVQLKRTAGPRWSRRLKAFDSYIQIIGFLAGRSGCVTHREAIFVLQ